jgi:L-threonylcarbamoyladenylate synthase
VKRLPFSDHEHVLEAARAASEVVSAGGVVLLPTETFYGLGVAVQDVAAVARVFEMKQRPREVALPVLCADWDQLGLLVEVPDQHRARLSRIWPAALTAVLPCRGKTAVAQGGVLAVRIPRHAMLRAMLYRVGPLTGTSANRHGDPPCVVPEEALRSLAAPPDLVLDAGETPGGPPSTVVDLSSDEARVLRPGAVSWETPAGWLEPV